ncbi:MAG: S8 family peptidase [Vicingus serpentipes]|nr:S8 family peptidase [Vicingus serpentipes]
MKRIILPLLLLISFSVLAQHSKINVALQSAIKDKGKSTELFPLFVVGNVALIKQEVLQLGGEVKLATGNVVQVKLPANKIAQLAKKDFVQRIPYSFSSGHPLSDTMTIHNNVTPVYNGDAPLFQSYTGKGVLFGIIDTGHDIVHPDFKDSLGRTRILRIWDQTQPDNGSSTFGYGIVWDSTSINNGSCTHIDYGSTSHGTHVSGIAVGNGLAVGNYRGVAPEASIVAVASDFNAPNWLFTVVDAVNYIYQIADSLNMPCVINASIGDYFGSHDGTDPAALLIDSLVNAKPGRAFVCAGGNAGHFNWHVGQQVTADTSFTWLKYNSSSALGFGSVFYEVWADTADFNNVDYAFGANLPSGSFSERGRTPFFNIKNRLGNFTDTIKNDTNILAIVETYAELQGDKYLLQVLLNEPDSNTYNFSILSTGSGRFDFWSTNLLGTSAIVQSGLPTVAQYPPMAYYTLPDSAKTTVSSFSCSPSVLTVANFVNRKTYLDVDSLIVVKPWTPGAKGTSSSIGPDRRGNLKPDIGATGDVTIGPNSAAVIAANLVSSPGDREKVAFGGMHRTNGGTSMASPVVAGIAALYLEKCPNATMAEIKNAITSTAKQDVHTNTVPNPIFGYGKVDAFAALNTSNYTYSLGADKEVCDGDSVQVNASGFTSYSWSTNETTSSIFVDTTKNIFVEVNNASGCKAYSDTISITWHALPIKPTVTVVGNDSLIYVTSLGLQWYFNSGSLLGEIDTLHVAQNSGDYFVQVTDSFGCKNNSDTVNVVILGIENNFQTIANVYPNPTTDKIIIELTSSNEIHTILLLNSLGETIQTKQLNNNELKHEFDLSELAKGVYYLKMHTDKKDYLQKVILFR